MAVFLMLQNPYFSDVCAVAKMIAAGSDIFQFAPIFMRMRRACIGGGFEISDEAGGGAVSDGNGAAQSALPMQPAENRRKSPMTNLADAAWGTI